MIPPAGAAHDRLPATFSLTPSANACRSAATRRAICADGAHSSRPNLCLCKECGVVPFIRLKKNAVTAGGAAAPGRLRSD